nr:hypothetical protein [Caldimonas sp.]
MSTSSTEDVLNESRQLRLEATYSRIESQRSREQVRRYYGPERRTQPRGHPGPERRQQATFSAAPAADPVDVDPDFDGEGQADPDKRP